MIPRAVGQVIRRSVSRCCTTELYFPAIRHSIDLPKPCLFYHHEIAKSFDKREMSGRTRFRFGVRDILHSLTYLKSGFVSSQDTSSYRANAERMPGDASPVAFDGGSRPQILS